MELKKKIPRANVPRFRRGNSKRGVCVLGSCCCGKRTIILWGHSPVCASLSTHKLGSLYLLPFFFLSFYFFKWHAEYMYTIYVCFWESAFLYTCVCNGASYLEAALYTHNRRHCQKPPPVPLALAFSYRSISSWEFFSIYCWIIATRSKSIINVICFKFLK